MSDAKRYLFAAVAFASIATACDRSPAAVASSEADVVAAQAAALDGLLSQKGDPGPLAPGGSLTTLFNRAIDKVAKEQGKAEAQKLAAPVREQLSQAEAAAKAGDQATASQKLAAARAESIRIIVTVLGKDAVASYVTDQARRTEELRGKVETAAKAGQDVAAARAILAKIDELLKTASAALAKGEAAQGLDAAAAAADLFPSLVRALTAPATKPPTTAPKPSAPGWSLTTLFSQAIATMGTSKGEAAAKEIRLKVERLNKEGKVALSAGDSATARRKLGEARAIMLQTIVDALGNPAVQGAIRAADAALTDFRARISAAAAAGKDVTRAKEAADKAASLLAQARDALVRGQLTIALDLASQAGEWITDGGGRVERAK